MAAPTYEVTAEALNLRERAGTQGRVLSVLKRGDLVVGAQPAQGGWMAVAAGTMSGFVATAFLREAQGAAPIAPQPHTPDVNVKDRELGRLHPAMRAKVEDLLQRFAQQGLPFRVFEAYRSPERQNWLYEQGRSRTGSKVTNARAWESFHQYGLAVDFVLFENGQWSWDDSGPRADHWRKLRQLIDQVGLRSLSWEVPHAEWQAEMAELRAGRWPEGGDDGWHDLMEAAVDRWRGQNLPGAPALASAERPPLTA